MDDILSNLTPPQLEAVIHKDGPMLVIAGAGSGKTRVVTRRIAYLISQGVWPSQILAMTFTNKAAKEMKSRVAALVGEEPRACGTFHSCCARFLRSDIELLKTGRTRDFTIYDTSEQQSVLKKVLKEANLKLPEGMTPRAFNELISKAKCKRQPFFDYAVGENLTVPEKLARIADLYEEKMIQLNAVDFDDLLLLTVCSSPQPLSMRDKSEPTAEPSFIDTVCLSSTERIPIGWMVFVLPVKSRTFCRANVFLSNTPTRHKILESKPLGTVIVRSSTMVSPPFMGRVTNG